MSRGRWSPSSRRASQAAAECGARVARCGWRSPSRRKIRSSRGRQPTGSPSRRASSQSSASPGSAASSACEKSPSPARRAARQRQRGGDHHQGAAPPAAINAGPASGATSRPIAGNSRARGAAGPGRAPDPAAGLLRLALAAAFLGLTNRLRLEVAPQIFVRLPPQAGEIEAHHSPPGRRLPCSGSR